MVKTVAETIISTKGARTDGEDLSLSVWASRSFDIDLIGQKCIDVQDHPILGKCYRVAVTSNYQDEQHVERQVENVSLSNKQPQVQHHGVVRNKEAIYAVKEAARHTRRH